MWLATSTATESRLSGARRVWRFYKHFAWQWGRNLHAEASLAVSSAQYILAAADFDGDGKLDLAVSDNANDSVDLYLGNGDGTSTIGPSLADETGSGYLLVGDFNGDGTPDIASSNYTDQNVNIFLNHGGQLGTATVSGVTVYGGGVHNVFASYGGNADYPSSQYRNWLRSAILQFPRRLPWLFRPPGTVSYGTVMQLTGSIAPPSSGSSVASGTMSFYDGGTLLGAGAVSNGQDAISVNDLERGRTPDHRSLRWGRQLPFLDVLVDHCNRVSTVL